MGDTEIDAARKRPGMFVGDTHDGSGLLHMIWEVVANALDEHLAGRCTRVDLELGADGSIMVDDDGAGIPVHEVEGIPFAERVLTTYHDRPTSDGHAPHEHVELHGVGVFVVCALSTWLELDVFRNGTHYAQRFERGRPVTPLRVLDRSDRKGTRVRFLPDPTIFSSTWVNPGPLVARLKEMSYLLPGLTFSFADRRQNRFHEPDGLLSSRLWSIWSTPRRRGRACSTAAK